MTSAAPPTEFFPGINFNPSFYNLGQSAVTLDYLNSNFLRSTGYAISRAQYTLFNGAVDIKQNLDVSGNVNAKAYFLDGVPFSPSQWTTSVNDIYYNTGNVGIGKTNPNSIYKLDVSGNINADKIFRAGTELTQYTDTNVRTVLSTSAGTNITWNTGTNKFDVAAPYTDTNTRTVLSNSAGSNMTWNTGTNKFDVAAPYTDTNTRMVLASSAGIGLAWNITTNKFDATYTYTLPIATTTILGGVKSDNDTVSIDGTGIIKVSGNSKYLTGGTVSNVWGWNGVTSLLGRVGTAGNLSTFSQVEDIVLRSQGRLLLQTGTGNTGLTIDGANNVLMRNNVSVGSATITSGYALDVTGNIITSGNITLTFASRSIFWFGTNSNLARVGITGEYSTSGVFGDIVLRSSNNLILQSGTGASAMFIDTTNNVFFRNNVGIGSSAITSGYSLDVSGNIITSGNIALVNTSRSIFWNGTNSNLARAGVAGEYSTSAAINDIVLRSGNNLILQSGTGAASVVINTSNNVGIGNAAPIAPLTIGNASLANNDGFIVLEKCTTLGSTRQFRIGLNANFDLAMGDYGGNNVAGTWLQALRIAYGATSDRLIIDNSTTSINNDLFITSSRLVLRGNQPTLYLRDTDNRSGMIHMNSNIMYFLNASGNDSETWTQQNGQGWCLQLNMNNNDATFGGSISTGGSVSVSGSLSVGGTNINSIIDQRIKDRHLFSVYRTSITFYSIFGGGYWEGVWDFETNLKFNEYSRPQLNVRWNISASINNGNGNDSNKYFFMNYFYNQLGNNIAFNTTHSYGTWSFQNWWGPVGNNYLRIICRLDAAADYLNINIS